MENKKQSLYTKYRPQTFDQVVGQKVAKKILINSIIENKINHAYLFYGIRGTGKTTLARIFAKSVNCENKIDHNPCNKCEMCVSINNGSAFDVIEIDAASNNGVDEIRLIKENTTFLTTSSKYKVYIIDEVHMLSKAAFNALLKTLEEPPKNTIFLLATTEIHKIPQTVLSRTVVVNLEIMSNDDINEGLEYILTQEGVIYDKDALKYITMTSGGSLRDAISALETTLLYNNELNLTNILSSLGLIDKDELKTLIISDINGLLNKIDESDKDPKKISLLIIEVMFELIKNGENKYIETINYLINSINSLKDPFLLKIALKTAFYNRNINSETIKESINVSRETIAENTILKENNPQIVENLSNNEEKEDILEENNDILENTNMENSVENFEVVVDSEIEEKVNIVTDFVDVNNYMFVIKNNNQDILQKIITRWQHKDSYSTRDDLIEVIAAISSTQPLATTSKTLILGFRNEEVIENFKKLSLNKKFLEFIKDLIGEYKFVLPVNIETWTKLISIKDTFDVNNEKYTDISLNINDYVITKTEEVVVKASELFGQENIIENE